MHHNEKKKQEEFLAKLAKETAGDKDQEKVIRQIKLREKSKRQFHRIRNTLNRLKSGGLAGMDVPVLNETGEIRGWRPITEPGELHDTVAERNRQHLNQASPTPFGHGPGYDLLHGDDRHTTAEKVLQGELEWHHPMEDVNNFIGNLAIAYD